MRSPRRSRSLRSRQRTVLCRLWMGHAPGVVTWADPLHRRPGGGLQVLVVLQGHRGRRRAGHAARKARKRKAQRPVQGKATLQRGSGLRGAPLCLPGAREGEQTRGNVLDAVRRALCVKVIWRRWTEAVRAVLIWSLVEAYC